MDEYSDGKKIFISNKTYAFELPEWSEWTCYMFGAKKGDGISYKPRKGKEPNWFVRWMMKVCFDCTWVKENNNV
jgi:hypothetical protein